MTREPREGGGEGVGDERVGKPGGCGRFYERGFFRPVVFSSFLLFFFPRTKENRVAVPFRRKQILSHTCYLR